MSLTAVAEVANPVVDEHARLQDGRHRGGDGGGADPDPDGRRGPRRVLFDDDVRSGDRCRCTGRVAADAGERRSEAGAEEAAGEGSSEHFFFLFLAARWRFYTGLDFPFASSPVSGCSASLPLLFYYFLTVAFAVLTADPQGFFAWRASQTWLFSLFILLDSNY
jgi:hypothetical protein